MNSFELMNKSISINAIQLLSEFKLKGKDSIIDIRTNNRMNFPSKLNNLYLIKLLNYCHYLVLI